MPGGDGTGPFGTGRGMGRGANRRGGGPTGICICPVCNISVPHKPGIPCNTTKCPKCGTKMIRG